MSSVMRADVREIDLRQLRRRRFASVFAWNARCTRSACAARARSKRLDVATRDDRPAHARPERGARCGCAARFAGSSRRPTTSRPIAAESRHGTRMPRPSARSSRRVPVRRRDDRLSAPDRVRERARRALLLLEVRRDVEVGGAEELDELLVADEAIVEDHVRVDAEPLARAWSIGRYASPCCCLTCGCVAPSTM